MDNRINTVVFEEDFRVCEKCGYEDGFHTMLKREQETIKWLFICPACHAIFDIGCSADNMFQK